MGKLGDEGRYSKFKYLLYRITKLKQDFDQHLKVEALIFLPLAEQQEVNYLGFEDDFEISYTPPTNEINAGD